MKIVDDIWEWIKEQCCTPVRWPLLVTLGGIPLLHLFVANYYELTFAQTLEWPAFRIGCGALLALTGILWVVVLHRRILRWLVAVTLVASGGLLAGPIVVGALEVVPTNTVLDRLFRQLVLLQQRDGSSVGGFRVSRFDPASKTQVWTTAQALAALFTVADATALPASERAHLQAGFEYIALRRQTSPDGWGYWSARDVSTPRPVAAGSANSLDGLVQRFGSHTVLEIGKAVDPQFVLPPELTDVAGFTPQAGRMTVSEIAGWVIVAQSLAVLAHLWDDVELPTIRDRIRADVGALMRRQNQSGDSLRSGGFSPIGNVAYPRTYSTVMGLWALLLAREARGVSGEYDAQIRSAVDWLLSQVDKDGWRPDPLRTARHDEWYPGLTAQTLYVLSLAERAELIRNTRAYREQRLTFIRNLQRLKDRGPCTNDVVSDIDQHLAADDFQLEGSSFAWGAWTPLAVAGILATEQVPDVDRHAAAMVLRDLTRRLHDHVETVPGTWELAESLFALAAMARQPH
jgi:hypothetical protein